MAYVTLLRTSARLAAIASALVCVGRQSLRRAPSRDGCPAPTSRSSSPAAPTTRPASAASARRSSTRSARRSAAARSPPTRSNYPASFDFLTRPTARRTPPTTSRTMVAAVPVDADRARRLLAGRRGRRHAGRHSAARQQARRRSARARRCRATSSPASPPSRCSATPRPSSAPDHAARMFGGRAIDLCKDGDPICSRRPQPVRPQRLRDLRPDPTGARASSLDSFSRTYGYHSA